MFENLILSNPIMEIFIAALLGAFLGIRREMRAQEMGEVGFMGFRTMTLIAVLGVISTLFLQMPYLPAVFFVGLVVFIGVAYANGVFNLQRIGLTTEISALLTFWIGVLVGLEMQFLAIILTILLASINAFKKELHSFIGTLKRKEWIGALQLLILSGAVLPVLPRVPIDPWGVLVPFNVWLLVILISGIGFIGYFLIKFFGARGGIPLTGFLGAIVSSTAVTTSMASQSKRSKLTGIFAVGILISIVTMQLRVIAEILIWGGGLLGTTILVIPLAMALVAASFALFFFIKTTKNHNLTAVKSDVKLESPFELKPALQFGFIFVFVLFALALGQQYLGNSGIYMAAIISGFIDVDAIVLSSLESVKLGEMSAEIAKNAIGIAIFMNTLIKILYVGILGSKKLLLRIAISVVFICLAGGVVLVLT
ncbi:MgtC/SapB family protein [Candidatus Gracilibacteria bacterium]|nr:MgtC/SapB family protein [Candidatus Gracilibacteria bacterium]